MPEMFNQKRKKPLFKGANLLKKDLHFLWRKIKSNGFMLKMSIMSSIAKWFIFG
jgi:hypothetical protein